MSARLDDERLEAILRSIGDHLVTTSDVEEDRGVVPMTSTRRRWRVERRRLVLAAAVVVAIVAVGAAIAPVRETVGEWLRLRDAGVSRVPSDEADPGDAPSFMDGLNRIDVSDALRRSGLTAADVERTSLGEPTVAANVPEGGVVFAWRSGSTSLWVRDTTTDGTLYVDKAVGPHAVVEPIDGLGDAAWFISGKHTLRTPLRRVAADQVVWWSSDDGVIEYRLESDLSQAEMVDIARLLN